MKDETLKKKNLSRWPYFTLLDLLTGLLRMNFEILDISSTTLFPPSDHKLFQK